MTAGAPAAGAGAASPLSLRALRIGVDGEALRTPLTGVGRYVLHIALELEALLPNARFFAYARGPLESICAPSPRWTLRIEKDARWRRLPSVAWLKLRSPRLLREDDLDLFWAGRTLLPALPRGVRSLSTVHDLNCWVVPETMPFKHRWAHRLWFGRDLRAADVVVANSHGTAARLLAMTGIRAHGVACPGVSADFAPHPPGRAAASIDADGDDGPRQALARLGVRAPYLLAVATLEPRKNLAIVLEAFLDLKSRGLLPGYQLALAGAPGWGPPGLRERLQAAAAQGVVGIGYVPDSLMPVLFRAAEALVFPSLYEGFGMPVIEARASGTRVVVSDVAELREVAGAEGTVTAPSAEAVAAGIHAALARPRPSAEGVAHTYSWARSARCMADLMLSACR